MYHKIFLVVITLFFSVYGLGQNFKKYRWKNRLLLVVADGTNQEIFQNQLSILTADTSGIEERKLITYLITPEGFRIHQKDKEWRKHLALYKKYKDAKSNFQIILIGLDGSIKHRQDTLLSIKKLYGIIDLMPMRRKELKNRQG